MTGRKSEHGACISCGEALTEGSRFCTHCGVPQSTPTVSDSTQTEQAVCSHCGGDGSGLSSETIYCPSCRWLRPLSAGYEIDRDVCMWRLDAEAMARLRSIQPLNMIAQKVSENIGRPWFEATVNGIRLGEDQLPDIFSLALRAARTIGLPHLPEIYVSGENMWDAVTLGSESSAFVSLGSVLTNMRGEDLLFLVAREMGHVLAGHALWRTVTELLRGRQGPMSLFGGGLMEFLNPAKLVQSAIHAPLMAWKRHSEITADRIGLLAVGKEEVAVRVLTQWTLKSFPLYQRINPDAWRRQENESDDATIRLSEWMMTANPYLARRLKILREFAASPEFEAWRAIIAHKTRDLPDFEPLEAKPKSKQETTELVRLRCFHCNEVMPVPRSALEGATSVNVRCANPACRKVTAVTPKNPRPPGPETMTQD